MNNFTRNSYQTESPRDRITRFSYWLGGYQHMNPQISTQQPSQQKVITQQTTAVLQASSNEPTYSQSANPTSATNSSNKCVSSINI
jgi:hypothetical protein